MPLLRIALALIMVLVIPQISGPQDVQRLTYNELSAKASKLEYIVQDLASILKANTTNHEVSDEAGFMIGIASEQSSVVDSLAAMLQIYDVVSSGTDRTQVRLIIDLRIRRELKMLDVAIGTVSDQIARTNNIGVATSTRQLRDELREVKTMLQRDF